jgi:hypothetical protein
VPTNPGPNALLTNSYRIVITNRAHTAPGVTTTFVLISALDTDRDGIPDSYETSIGLNPNDPADATGDLDGDGMSNYAEYLAGTDPTNPNSYLRVDQNTMQGMATVIVAAVSNRTYTVQYTDKLPAVSWSKLADIFARSTNHVEMIKDPAWTTNRFYRVALPAQP